MVILKPRLFISYAHEDFDFATALVDALGGHHYSIFFDKQSIRLGDLFPQRIVTAIRRSDACILIISRHSTKSEWCKLEAYYAHFFKRPLIPIRFGPGDYDAESPLRSIQKDIQYAVADPTTGPAAVVDLIQDKLRFATRNAWYRLARYTLTPSVIVVTILLIVNFVVRRVNQLAYEKERTELLSSIRSSTRIFRSGELTPLQSKFTDDIDLVAALHLQEADPGLSDNGRLNSTILSSLLLRSYTLSHRQYYKDIDWHLSTLQNGMLINCTFTSGNIAQVAFRNSELDNVFFSGIDSGRKGVGLSGLAFDNCSFNAVELDRCNAIDLTFKDCRFRGSVLNTTNFGAVYFFSDTTNPSPVISNGQLTFFDNCIFVNDNPPDPSGVMVLGKEEEMQFIGVVFDRCTFQGLFRPEWFRNCSFTNCRFPAADAARALRNRSNTIDSR
jgi:hypothetical protein